MAAFLSQVAQITPNLYLSGYVGASESNVIKYGITCIITVCKEIPKLNIPLVESIKLEVLDKPNENLERYFDYVADKINDVVERKGACLVHCVAGISRSTSMCIAYLMKYHNMSLKAAHDLVRSKRHFIRPNLGFWKQLVDYERRLFGKNSVKMITSSIGLIPDVYEDEINNMIWSSPNNFLIPNKPVNSANSSRLQNIIGSAKSNYGKQSLNNGGKIIKPSLSSSIPSASASTNSGSGGVLSANSAVLNKVNVAGVNEINRVNRSYYQTTYGSSYCVQKR